MKRKLGWRRDRHIKKTGLCLFFFSSLFFFDMICGKNNNALFLSWKILMIMIRNAPALYGTQIIWQELHEGRLTRLLYCMYKALRFFCKHFSAWRTLGCRRRSKREISPTGLLNLQVTLSLTNSISNMQRNMSLERHMHVTIFFSRKFVTLASLKVPSGI